MVKLPWGEYHLKEAPQPLPTRYQLFRPDFLLQLHSYAHLSVSLACMAYTGKLGPWAI